MISGASLRGRDLISAADLSASEVAVVLERAAQLKAEFRATGRHAPAPLAGRTLALLFDKPSLRTRVTFEAGMTQLGGHGIYLAGEVGLGQRESVSDVARNLSRWVDAIAIRTFEHTLVEELAARATVPVINALTDHEHPCQALADLFTIREHVGHREGVVLAFVGDGNNVFHSLALLGGLVGLEVRLAHPPGYGPDAGVVERARVLAAASGGAIVLGHDPRAAVRGADIVYTDTWISMGQEADVEARRAAFAGFRVDDALLDEAGPGAFVMHCLPAHRGEEITDEALDGPRSLVLEQAENRLHVQKALLVECIAGDPTVAHQPAPAVPADGAP
ncbi:MAG TPA: ornithine carbamoyltransferase [Candidatus Limnocylindrales bacterium]